MMNCQADHQVTWVALAAELTEHGRQEPIMEASAGLLAERTG